MNKGGWLFVIIVGGYIAFEISMLNRLGYRMEVDHVLDQMVSAQHAVARCGNATSSQKKKFARRLATLETRATRELAESDPSLDSAQIAAVIAGQMSEIQQSVDASIASLGCDSPEVETLFRRYTIYAGKS